MKLLSDIDVSGKRVFLRADLDVRILDVGDRISETTRLLNLKPTIEYLLASGAGQIFIAGHVGRPKGTDPALSTVLLEAPLEAILKRSVTFKRDLDFGDGTLASMAQIILLENLRFRPGEKANDADFTKQLAGLADVYVNDAFAASHRAHASIVGVPAILPHAAGLHLQKEVESLTKLLESAQRPFVAVVGGAKTETKVPVVENLAKIADQVLAGGAIAKEFPISNFKFPISNVVIAKLAPNTKDIDQESTDKFIEIIKGAKTVVWNGPMGVFEEGFDAGTMAVAQAIAASEAYSVVGGGETTEFLASWGMIDKFSFVSSGGGAMLEFLAGKELPGIVALE